MREIDGMEIISLELVVNFLENNTLELKSTHNKLCYPILERIYKKMVNGIKFSGIKVEGNIIIDGHHRYLASLLANIKLEQHPYVATSATKIYDWKSVDFVEEDWDTEAKIILLNKIDADYNGLTLNKLNELIK